MNSNAIDLVQQFYLTKNFIRSKILVNTGASNLEQLHEEIEPILNENGVLEASNIEIKIDNANKVEVPKTDIASIIVWCQSLGAYVQPGKCPQHSKIAINIVSPLIMPVNLDFQVLPLNAYWHLQQISHENEFSSSVVRFANDFFWIQHETEC